MKTIKITNKTGIHARPAGMIINEAKNYEAEITLTKDGKAVNAKSIMGILGMGISEGDLIEIKAEGPMAEEAVDSIYSIFEKINQE